MAACRELGYFVDVGPFITNRVLTQHAQRMVKLWALTLSLETLLEPMKALSKEGQEIKDPWGITRKVRPFMASIVADDPEIKDHGKIRYGEHQCDACMVRPRCDSNSCD